MECSLARQALKQRGNFPSVAAEKEINLGDWAEAMSGRMSTSHQSHYWGNRAPNWWESSWCVKQKTDLLTFGANNFQLPTTEKNPSAASGLMSMKNMWRSYRGRNRWWNKRWNVSSIFHPVKTLIKPCFSIFFIIFLFFIQTKIKKHSFYSMKFNKQSTISRLAKFDTPNNTGSDSPFLAVVFLDFSANVWNLRTALYQGLVVLAKFVRRFEMK